MKRFSTAIVYASLAFVLLYLYRFDYLAIPPVGSPVLLLPAVLLVPAALALEAMAWRTLLAAQSVEVSPAEAIAASGLSVLGKYIPGKVWLIVGRAAFVARRHATPIGEVSFVALSAQVLSLFVALAIGSVGLALVGRLQAFAPITLLLLAVFALVLFASGAHRAIERTLGARWPALAGRLPSVEPGLALRVLPPLVACWLLMMAGFHATVVAISGPSVGVPAAAAFGFPLAAALGMVAVFSPGGLGIREGVLATYLVACGVTIEWSTTIAVVSRLWFLAGELAFFGVGLVCSRVAREPIAPTVP